LLPRDVLRTGELTRQPNLLDPFKVWVWDPVFRKARSSFRCGTATAWNSTRTCQAWALVAAFETSTVTPGAFANHVVTASPGASSR
jgi:hypothetical protein